MSVQGPNVAAMGATGGTQLSFADLAHAQGAAWTPADEMSLRETTFVVVDLEPQVGARRVTTQHRRTRSPKSGRSRYAAARCSVNSPPW